MTPALEGVLETSLYVDDLGRSLDFYGRLFRFPTLFVDERACALSVARRQVLLLFKKGASAQPQTGPGGTIPGSDGSGPLHLAFSVPAQSLPSWRRRLAQQRVAVESEVRWERGGRSLYFRDPDRNVIELVTPGCWAIY